MSIKSLTIHSAGSRDSALTVHGNLQTERLADHLVNARQVRFTHIFTSNLQRAYRTAGAIKKAQDAAHKAGPGPVTVVQLPVLREQDFGFYEGKPFYARGRDGTRSGKEEHRLQHLEDPDFNDVESKEALDLRVSQFIGEYLVTILATESEDTPATVAVVSHGMTLSHLWRCLLKCFPKKSVRLSLGDTGDADRIVSLEHLGGWSNTAFLELQISLQKPNAENVPTAESAEISAKAEHDNKFWFDYEMTIRAINSRAHLAGLKRTRGVGSSQFDEGQKKIETFFKKPKV